MFRAVPSPLSAIFFISVMELAEEEIHVISLYGVHELMLWITITLTVLTVAISITVHGWITISTHAFVAITSDSISMARCHGHYLLSCSFGYYMWTASTRYSTLVLLFFLASFFCKDKQKQSSYFNQSFSCPYFKHAKITCTCNNTHPHVS